MYDALLAATAPVLGALGEAGVTDPDEQVHLTRVLRSALHGFIDLEQHGGFGLPASVDESFRRLVELLVAGAAPARPPRRRRPRVPRR